jgi:protein-S-isoprenylcysteine O-methyltransferase Ste14
MSRGIVGAIFGLVTLATLAQALEYLGDAVAEPSGRAWLVAAFWALKSAVVATFCWAILRRAPAKRPNREPIAFAACTIVILSTVAIGGPGANASTALLVGGEVIALLSCAFLLCSVLALGTCFGVLPEARGLVRRGPYRIVRHPVYLGELGVCAGLVIGAPTIWNVACAAVILAAQIVRMRLEERALEAEFPEYADYARRTARIVPWPARRRFAISSTSPQEA